MVVGVPDIKALERVKSKLVRHQIPHFNWVEPDYDLGFTSIATTPIRDDKRQFLRNYRVWSHSPVPQFAEDRPLKPFMQV